MLIPIPRLTACIRAAVHRWSGDLHLVGGRIQSHPPAHRSTTHRLQSRQKTVCWFLGFDCILTQNVFNKAVFDRPDRLILVFSVKYMRSGSSQPLLPFLGYFSLERPNLLGLKLTVNVTGVQLFHELGTISTAAGRSVGSRHISEEVK